ncbi:TlpA disulfide reductase family protein [Fluviicola sp.]|uniref:TlpA family protein disulfide reductase n=1 Tax=Fluviicola sp. TaxID=1917219 RepID=UPI00262EBC0F|nr:TlpA disulfide reductase family protein [Fluviicola sp.]
MNDYFMKKIPISLLLILSSRLFGQSEEQQQILEKTIEKYQSHRSVSYDITYEMKYFDDEKPNTVTSHVDMLKSETDSVFKGFFVYDKKDSFSNEIKYYKPTDLFVIDLNKEVVIKFDAAKKQTAPITGKMDGSVLKIYFLEIDKLQRKLKNPLNKWSCSDTAGYLKVNINYPDDEDYYGREEAIYIDRKTKTITQITYLARYKDQVQRSQSLISNLTFDHLNEVSLEKRTEHYLQTFKVQNYQPLTKEDYKLLENGTVAPKINGTIFPNYDDTIELSVGKVMILDFWFTTCMPCIKAIPDLNRLKQKYKDKIEIIGINPFENQLRHQAKIEQFLQRTPMDYPILLVNEVPEEYNIQGFPTLYVIDQHGKVRFSSMGLLENTYEELGKVLEQITNN